MRQQPIPEAALRDQASVEIGRIWIAERGLHCSLRVGLYKEVREEKAWGMILADMANHIANAIAKEFGKSKEEALGEVLESFNEEISSPTSEAKGSFVSGRA